MSGKMIGRDVSVYSWQEAGFDTSPAAGAITSMLGRWKSIEIKVKKEWVDVSASDAHEPEKRKKMESYSVTCKNFIDNYGSQAMFAGRDSDLVVITFTDIYTGKTVTFRGGITEVGLNYEAEGSTDDLSAESVGNSHFGGLPSLSYL